MVVAFSLALALAESALAQRAQQPYEQEYPPKRQQDDVRPVDPPKHETPERPPRQPNEPTGPPAEESGSGSLSGVGTWAAIGGAVAGGIILGKILTRDREKEEKPPEQQKDQPARPSPTPPPKRLVERVTVPDLTGKSVEEAASILGESRLKLGKQSEVESEGAPETIRAQTPKPGTQVLAGSPVHVVVAVGARVIVPDLTKHSVEEATEILKAARLTLGKQNKVESEVARQTVQAQTPRAGARVLAGSQVHVMVAVPAKVTVPDLTNRSVAQASEILKARRLALGQRSEVESESEPGTVRTQNPPAGTRVVAGTQVHVRVAVPIQVVVPDLTDRSVVQASEILRARRLMLGQQSEVESESAPGTIRTQNPPPGTRVVTGTPVHVGVAVPIQVTQSPRVTVPDLTNRTLTEASQILRNNRLTLGQKSEVESEGEPGTIRTQSPAAGTHVVEGTTVNVAVAVPFPDPAPPQVVVPDLTGLPLTDAIRRLAETGLGVGNTSREESEAPENTVTAQIPQAGTRVAPGTPVHLVAAIPVVVLTDLEKFLVLLMLIVLIAVSRMVRPAKEAKKRRKPPVRQPIRLQLHRDRGNQHIDREKVAQTELEISIRAVADAGKQLLHSAGLPASQRRVRRVA